MCLILVLSFTCICLIFILAFLFWSSWSLFLNGGNLSSAGCFVLKFNFCTTYLQIIDYWQPPFFAFLNLNVDVDSIWSSFCTYSGNIGIPWVYFQGYSKRVLPYRKKRICSMGWFWSRILHQPCRSRGMEKSIHRFWLCSIWGYGNLRENFSASN